MLSVKDVADRMGVDRQTIYLWIKKGLRTTYIYKGIRRVVRIKEEDLDDFINSKRKK